MFVAAICTQCGAKIEVDDAKNSGVCRHCGTTFVTQNAIQNYETRLNIHFNGEAQFSVHFSSSNINTAPQVSEPISNHPVPKRNLGVVFSIVITAIVCLFMIIGLPIGLVSCDEEQARLAERQKRLDEEQRLAEIPTADDIVITEALSIKSTKTIGNYNYYDITVAVKNTHKNQIGYISITVSLYDAKGTVIGSSLTNHTNLAGGESWRIVMSNKMVAVSAGIAVKAEITKITVYK